MKKAKRIGFALLVLFAVYGVVSLYNQFTAKEVYAVKEVTLQD